jgi:hypothetical protein
MDCGVEAVLIGLLALLHVVAGESTLSAYEQDVHCLYGVLPARLTVVYNLKCPSLVLGTLYANTCSVQR